MSDRISTMFAHVLPQYQLVVEPGDEVLIITDKQVEPECWQVFGACAAALKAKPQVMIMEPLERDYMNPSKLVYAAAEAADVIHYAASTALVHSEFGRYMTVEREKRRINSDGITARQLVEGAILADPQVVRDNRAKIEAFWDKGETVRVTTRLGTDLTVSIKGRRHFGSHKARHIQFPGGEAMLPPLEDTANGTIVIDKCIHYIGAVSDPVRLEVRDGNIRSIDGGDDAVRFQQWLESYADPSGWRLCELAVGVNPKAFWMGLPRQDRFVLGSCHFGFGVNDDVGGTISGGIHYDVILSKPTIAVDGQEIIRNGLIQV